jgi:hypothetical protein
VEETGVHRENNQPVTCKSILQSKIKHNNGALRIWFLKTDLQNKVIRVHMYLQQSYEWEILVHLWNTVVSEVFSCFHADSEKVKGENCLEIEKCNYSQYKFQKKNLLNS